MPAIAGMAGAKLAAIAQFTHEFTEGEFLVFVNVPAVGEITVFSGFGSCFGVSAGDEQGCHIVGRFGVGVYSHWGEIVQEEMLARGGFLCGWLNCHRRQGAR